MDFANMHTFVDINHNVKWGL